MSARTPTKQMLADLNESQLPLVMPDHPPPYTKIPIPGHSGSPPDPGHGGGENCNLEIPKSEKILLHSSEKKTKTTFLRKVYCVLVGQGIIVQLIILGFYYIPQLHSKFKDMSGFLFWPCWLIGLAISCSITTFEKIMRKPPLHLVLLAIITVASGILLGTLSAFFDTDQIFINVGIISAICVFVVFFTLQPWYFFTPIISICFTWTLVGISFGSLCIWYSLNDAFYIILTPLIVMTYIVTATQMETRSKKRQLLSNEYIYGATRILMLLVSIFADRLRRIPCLSCCVFGQK